MNRSLLHFTLGPVQGFIMDARRTRDLWAGSFLLSWLSGHAISALVEEAIRQGFEENKIISFPDVAGDDLYEAIRAHRAADRVNGSPYIGSLPNRFKADVSGLTGDAGQICRDAVLARWQTLSDAVWKKFVKPLANDQTHEVWRRQTGQFWDMNWVFGEEPDDNSDGNWLDQRKNWRNNLFGPEDAESGDLCRLMGRLQEISGFHRIGNKTEQAEFWEKLADKAGPLNLKKDERLCSIALIKRLFPLIAEDVIGWRPGGEAIDIVHWPSVSYIAAVPWLKAAQHTLGNSEQSSYWKNADENLETDYMGEASTRLFSLPANGLFKLDGHLLHQDGVRAWESADLKGDTEADRAKRRRNLLYGLRDIEKKIGDKASEFYAVLLMDGDRVGAKIGGHQEVVKKGLATFTQSVKLYFDPTHPGNNPANGVLIYAGGDDVLALVPVDTAIESVKTLRAAYLDAFAGSGAIEAGEEFTVSAAILFAQYNIPLRAVLKQAHLSLDSVAKERNGRDSLALAVMKPGGIAFDWVSCWSSAPITALEGIAKNRSTYSSGFFYNVRERYAPLFEGEDGKSSERAVPTDFAETALMQAVLTAEYKKQPGRSGQSNTMVEAAVRQLMHIGKPLINKDGTPQPSDAYNFDGALVARFLSVEGRWHLLSEDSAATQQDEDNDF